MPSLPMPHYTGSLVTSIHSAELLFDVKLGGRWSDIDV